MEQQDDALRLEVVSEELAVANDELLVKQRKIDELLQREADARTSLRETVAAVPVPDGARPDDAALQAVAAITRLPVGEASTHDLLAGLARLAVQAVAGADWASVVLGDPGAPADTASDSEVAQRADGAQWAAHAGPCLLAWRGASVVRVEDLRTDVRWPALHALPVRSVLAVPVLLEGTAAGVLNLYGERPGALGSATALSHAEVFAAAAGALLQGARRVEQLRTTADQLAIAMQSRATIEQAKGLIAGRLECTVEQAFEVLTKLSQDRNVKLRDLAALVVADPARRDLTPLLRHVHERLTRTEG